MNAPRRSRAFWVVPCQPVQELFGAQGDDPDPVAGMVLMTLISDMAMKDGFKGVPAFHVSISQRELAKRTGRKRKAVCNALARLEKRGHLTPIKGPSDGTRRGPNARITYRIDLLADEATAFHRRGPSPEPSGEPQAPKKGPSYIQTEIPDGEQIPPLPPAPAVVESSSGKRTNTADGGEGGEQQADAPTGAGKPHPSREWARPYYEAWVKRFGGQPDVGFLRKKVEPLERADGRDVTIRRWQQFLPGLNPRFFSTKGDPLKNAVLRFAGAPAPYDAPDWYLSDRDRAEFARLTEGL